jgi:type II secretory pathway component HofQ
MVRSGNNSVENRAETTARLLETKIYTIKRNTISGFFPVFVVDLDFSVMLDSTTETAIMHYIGDTPVLE